MAGIWGHRSTMCLETDVGEDRTRRLSLDRDASRKPTGGMVGVRPLHVLEPWRSCACGVAGHDVGGDDPSGCDGGKARHVPDLMAWAESLGRDVCLCNVAVPTQLAKISTASPTCMSAPTPNRCQGAATLESAVDGASREMLAGRRAAGPQPPLDFPMARAIPWWREYLQYLQRVIDRTRITVLLFIGSSIYIPSTCPDGVKRDD
ncbi:hypothetical protein B2J93_2482 [Marssonina coronariae]|uniref:Uncharacterized protein n=1 Tax=Diplocarpon coronariae TaxID=2795749 RepID=A0A218YSV3_9HELO|nr:hypothetical protein B2J93_2482 [Marssonina coronariae]